MYKLLTFSISCALLTACGGSSGSSTPTPVPAPTPTPVEDTNVPVTISAKPANSGNMQCNMPTEGDEQQTLLFVEVATEAGITQAHSNPNGDGVGDMSGGVAAGDINHDGFVDLYTINGDGSSNGLLINQGDGTFKDEAGNFGVALQHKGSGPAFADVDGDGLLDLFVGAVTDNSPTLFINQGNGSFINQIADAGLFFPDNTFSATWGDYDKDGDLDLVTSHWTNTEYPAFSYLWQNQGDMTFVDASEALNIPDQSENFPTRIDRSFTPSFTDINNDGWLDLLFVIDNGATKVYINQKDGQFLDATDEQVITDLAGMGSAIGDYDNDGDLDWFVTSISYRDGVTNTGSLTPGNRFYQNNGDGTFTDVTDETGTRHGYWGWAACFSDLNNDMNLDIFHVNGMLANGDKNIDEMFETDPSRLFMSNGDGTFTEQAVATGIEDNGLGRGIVCFDYDRDGDQDLFINNYNAAPKLFCNQGNSNHFINVQLRQSNQNTQALGAKVYVTAGGIEQLREIRSGNNFVSQNPAEAHFGLADNTSVESIRIVWPDGEESLLEDVDADQFLVIEREE